MLPDFPSMKEKTIKLLTSRMQMMQNKMGSPILGVRKRIVHEGKKIILIREDGSVSELEMKKIAVGVKLKLEDVERMTQEDILKMFDKMASEAAFQQSKIAYDEIEKITGEIGNIIDVKGRALSVNDIMQMFEKIWIDFDKDGKPIMPTIVAGKKAYRSLSEVLPQLETDHNVKERFSQIMQSKKRNWRAREANRKLVG
jgi:hypothetical protein